MRFWCERSYKLVNRGNEARATQPVLGSTQGSVHTKSSTHTSSSNYTKLQTTPQSITLWQQLDEQVRYAKMERRRQEKVTLGGSLGTSFSGRCGAGLEKDEGQAKSLIKGLVNKSCGPIRLRSSNWNTNIGSGSSDATHAVSQATTVIQK
ncbi:uncharacterized protein LOC135104619 [Scylla paramamosain]|uniref:uncharacterized protein LOC135104619 n=1 Tax=Scylla paramamosain TaxID=85552 RepID=UPI003083228A